jgi:hypothetical protein
VECWDSKSDDGLILIAVKPSTSSGEQTAPTVQIDYSEILSSS